jgi:peptidoglycan/xylan/chitin deacetylase (PgdA/CDA1 family)
MVKIVAGGIIATVAVIIMGVIVALPPFIQPPKATAQVLLTFSIVSENNMPTWCDDLKGIFARDRLHAVVFFTGKIAEKYPECVGSFDENVDIGSSTYSYKTFPSIQDYSEQLNEVKEGKKAVDISGSLNSKSFKAPHDSSDDNIYSLLSRNGILADFSYSDRYHKVHEDKFIWFKATAYNASSTTVSKESISKLQIDRDSGPVEIDFDNTVPTSKIDEIIRILQDKKVVFVNASELTGIQLTIRGGV